MRLTDFIRILVALRDGGKVVYQDEYDEPACDCAASHPNGLSRGVNMLAVFRCQRAGLIDVIRESDNEHGFRYEYGLTVAGIEAARTIDISLDRALATRVTNS